MRNQVYTFCPATVANICCGFDALGFSLERPGDVIKLERTEAKGVHIKDIHGADLPFDIELNVAGKAAQSLLDRWGVSIGVELTLWKGISPGSGIGSSSASASGAAAAVAFLLERSILEPEVLEAALDGEEIASGSRHADNVAPALYGGWVLSSGVHPTTHIQLINQVQLDAVVLHPDLVIKTADARNALTDRVLLTDAVKQAANLGMLTAALQQGNVDLVQHTLVDFIAEPQRKKLIHEFGRIKKIALSASSIGGGISGSGPSTFWMCLPEHTQALAQELKALVQTFDITYTIYQGPISPVGARIIEENEVLQYIR